LKFRIVHGVSQRVVGEEINQVDAAIGVSSAETAIGGVKRQAEGDGYEKECVKKGTLDIIPDYASAILRS
jgi:hypothetical protein